MSLVPQKTRDVQHTKQTRPGSTNLGTLLARSNAITAGTATQLDSIPTRHHVNSLIQDRREKARNAVAREAAAILAGGHLLPRTDASAVLKAAIKHQLDYGLEGAANILDIAISQRMQNGMKLKLTEEPRLKAAIQELMKQSGQPIADFIQTAELFDGQGNSRGKVAMIVRSSAQDLAIALRKEKLLSVDSETATKLTALIRNAYRSGGTGLADGLAMKISKDLPDGMELKISNDPRLRVRLVRQERDLGNRAPEYIRRIELIDREGKILGRPLAVALVSEDESPEPRRE